jgi:chitinase
MAMISASKPAVPQVSDFKLIIMASPGCSSGNCLRSHVNWTETLSAFSMITKAGVPTTKVMVGMALYGRSFEMTTAGCYTDMCTYTGPDGKRLPQATYH